MRTERLEHCLRQTGLLLVAGAALSGLMWLVGVGEEAWVGFPIATCMLLAVGSGRHREPRE